ncbi:lysophospholipase [Oenococcus sp. UCMA 17063]|nr:lysophospholipase [Oenococcus sp. UCMA 17063]
MNTFPLTIKSNAFLGSWIENSANKQIFSTNIGAEIWLKSNHCSKIIFDWPNKTLGKDRSRILISIDGADFYSQTLSDHTIRIDLNPDSDHLIRIMTQAITFVRAQSWNLSEFFLLKKISFDGELFGAVPSRKSLVFIGDSIINGQKVLPDSFDTSAHRPDKSWAYLLSEKLYFNNLRIAYGGTGITQRANIYPPTAIDFIWNSALNVSRPIDYSQSLAGVIVNLGTNDCSASSEEFSFSLKALLRELKKRFHETKIIVIEPFNGCFKDVFRRVFKGEKHISLIENNHWDFEISDHAVHLSAAGHRQAAKTLLPLIKEKLDA